MQRIVLVPVDADESAHAAGQLILDLLVDSATSRSSGPFPAFGRKGDFRQPATVYPFTLMVDGRLDFGAFAPDEARLDVLAVRQALLATGEEIACSGPAGISRYRIVSADRL